MSTREHNFRETASRTQARAQVQYLLLSHRLLEIGNGHAATQHYPQLRRQQFERVLILGAEPPCIITAGAQRRRTAGWGPGHLQHGHGDDFATHGAAHRQRDHCSGVKPWQLACSTGVAIEQVSHAARGGHHLLAGHGGFRRSAMAVASVQVGGELAV